MSRFLVWATAYFYLIYGTMVAFFPAESLAFLAGSGVTSPAGLTDIRANYGGLAIAIGMIMLVFVQQGRIFWALTVMALALLSMASTRFIGIVVDGSTTTMVLINFSLEVLFGFAALFCLRFRVSNVSSQAYSRY